MKSKDKIKEDALHVIGPSTKAKKAPTSATGPKIDIIRTYGDRIGDMASPRSRKISNPDSVVYSIPCLDCDLTCIGESFKGLDV